MSCEKKKRKKKRKKQKLAVGVQLNSFHQGSHCGHDIKFHNFLLLNQTVSMTKRHVLNV